MITKILKATTKGQITLPKQWRDKHSTDNFSAKFDDNRIIIEPVETEKWETVFDADKDNNGKGIELDEMISKLKKIKNG